VARFVRLRSRVAKRSILCSCDCVSTGASGYSRSIRAKDVLAQDPGTRCDPQTGPANAVGIDGRHSGDCKPRNSLQPTLFIHPAASCHENHLRYLETAAPVSCVLEIVAVPAVNCGTPSLEPLLPLLANTSPACGGKPCRRPLGVHPVEASAGHAPRFLPRPPPAGLRARGDSAIGP
jgi:hypothetical protein